jgi:hypothetical protein
VTARKSRQKGIALLLFAAIASLVAAGYVISAVSKLSDSAGREARTGQALRAAKEVLIGYVIQSAANSSNATPGQLPCPEALSSIGTPTEGLAAASCASVTAVVGRLPWKTLGIDDPRDGDGYELWYVVSPGFGAGGAAPINFGTLAKLPFDGAPINTPAAAVAVIIAPGAALNTQSAGTPPAGCSAVNQQSNRFATPLDPAKFLECGNATGSYGNPGSSQWSNDRAIAITQNEWIDAIAAPVADRLQRQVAPALASWDQLEQAARGRSWGNYARGGGGTWAYLPYAAAFTNPADPLITTTSFCGNAGQVEGLTPVLINTQCPSSWSLSSLSFTGISSTGCTASAAQLVCRFPYLGGSSPTATIRAVATNVSGNFRETLRSSAVILADAGTGALTSGTVTISVSSISASPGGTSTTPGGAATAVISVSWPGPLTVGHTYTVTIPSLSAAAVLSDSRVTWFTSNEWHRYTYYAVGRGTTVSPSGSCAAPGDSGCLIVNGVPAFTGNTNDKKLVLTLMGRALSGQSQPSSNPTNYLESHSVGTSVFASSTVTKTFNDRLAACPFQYGGVTICN